MKSCAHNYDIIVMNTATINILIRIGGYPKLHVVLVEMKHCIQLIV